MTFEAATDQRSPETYNCQRHDWVYLSETGWQTLMRAMSDDVPELEAWHKAGWPLVVRRQDADVFHDQTTICVGAALPRATNAVGQKGRRIALRVAQAGVRAVRPPLMLEEVMPLAPIAWQAALQALLHEAETLGLVLQVYGSLAFQALTGVPYVDAQSDLDLLLRVERREQFNAALQLFARFSVQLPLDGEIIFPNGLAVAWKECWQVQPATDDAQTFVLVKSLTQVKLLSMQALLLSLN